ncbi:major facilitator superfamily transporter [Ophiostoma piceae UAMH 11346]|uniref:Efflux pump dotC n=1 Tax=Ophiostoma piceae (strain UAMH 11346) TaxID=1262450 RepID=S3CC55_OPHP1|nr:major facilitator superfamily transporter [Ophiostoma piceae UAMH 11346]
MTATGTADRSGLETTTTTATTTTIADQHHDDIQTIHKDAEVASNGNQKNGHAQDHSQPSDPSVLREGDGEAKTDDNTTATPAPLYEESRTRLETLLIMVSLCSALFLGALDVTIVTVAIPTISAQFNSTIGYTWIGSAYLLANAATAPSWGKISDIWGRKPILLISVAIFWIGSLLCAVSVDMTMLIISRAIQGIGSGGIVILVNVCIGDLFSMRKRSQYYGIVGMVWAFAGGIGPVVGGALTENVTWRWCFYINLPISGLGFILLVFVLKLHNPKTPMRDGLRALDWRGSLLVTAGTLLILLGLTFGGVTYPWKSKMVITLIVVGAVVLVMFAYVEARLAQYPIIPLYLFRKRVAVAAFMCCFCHGLVFVSGSYYLPLYFQAVLGATPLLSGVYVLPYTISLAMSGAVTGWAIKRTGKYTVFIIGGFMFLTTGFALFTNLGAHANWAKIIVYQMVAALGVGPNFQSLLIAVHTTVEHHSDLASATATFGFIRQMSTSISVVLGGVVFQNRMQQQHASLVAKIGEASAELLTGSTAASNVDRVGALLKGPALAAAREAYWKSIQTMYIMYGSVAGVGLIICFFIRETTLSTEHQDHKTGLANMRARGDDTVPSGDSSQTAADVALAPESKV